MAANYFDAIGRPRTIAELTKQRLRKSSEKARSDLGGETADTGFRVFKLDKSNIRAWQPDAAGLEASLFENLDHIVLGRSADDLLYELLLKLGLDLCVEIAQRTVVGKTVYAVGGGVLMACLEDNITSGEVETVGKSIVAWRKELAPASDTTCVFRDSAFADDVAKTNMAAILEQNGIQTVRSL